MNRKFFFSRRMDYLFSFDLNLARNGAQALCPEAITSKTVQQEPDRNDPPPRTVYHALRESHVMGEPVVQGHVVLAQERIQFHAGADFGDISGRLVLRTEDDVLIEGSYQGVVRTRQRWPVLWRQDGPGYQGPGNEKPIAIETKAYISAHFETGSTRYAWLPQHQCIGYGKLTLLGGEPERASFDVYALGA